MTSRFCFTLPTTPETAALVISAAGLIALAWVGIGPLIIGLIVLWVLLAFLAHDRQSWNAPQVDAGANAVVSHQRIMRHPSQGIGASAIVLFTLALFWGGLQAPDADLPQYSMAFTAFSLAGGWMAAAGLARELHTLVIDESGIRRSGAAAWDLPWYRISLAQLKGRTLWVNELRAGPASGNFFDAVQWRLRDAARNFPVPARDRPAVQAILDRYSGEPRDQITEGPPPQDRSSRQVTPRDKVTEQDQ